MTARFAIIDDSHRLYIVLFSLPISGNLILAVLGRWESGFLSAQGCSAAFAIPVVVMARRATHTLVFLGVNRTERVDFGPGPDFAVVGQLHQTTLANEEPEIRLEAVLVGGAKVGKTVWVLWEGATAIMLDMASGVVSGLEKNELADALSFEAEPLTGLPAPESAIGGIGQRNARDVLPDTKRYWVTQISSSLRDKLDEAVIRVGAKLGGIAHPGGLPRAHWSESAEAELAVEWRRVEIWDELTFSLYGRTDGTVETRVIRSSPGSEKWASELPTEGPVSWMGPGPVTRVGPDGRRVTDALTLFAPDGTPLETEKIELSRDKVPVEWLRAWIEELTSTTPRVPVVERFSDVSPNRKFFVSGGVVAALVLAVCVAQGEVLSYQTATANERAGRLEQLRAQMVPVDNSKKDEAETRALADRLKSQLADLTDQWQKLKDQVADMDKKEGDIESRRERVILLQTIHRPALAALLKAVAGVEQDPHATVVIKDVREAPDGSNLVLTGLCRHATAANLFAVRLQEQLSGSGWLVGAAQKRLRGDLQAFDFTLVLTPAALNDSASAAMIASAAAGTASVSPAPAPLVDGGAGAGKGVVVGRNRPGHPAGAGGVGEGGVPRDVSAVDVAPVAGGHHS